MYDCCRDITSKGESKEDKSGHSFTFYAAIDGSQASAGKLGDGGMFSPTTQAWLAFMEANPGAVYP